MKRLRRFVDDRRPGVELFWSFVLSLLFGTRAQTPIINSNEPGAMAGWNTDELTLLIEEGRRQLDRQTERMRHTTDRAQVLLAIGLAVVAFGTSTLSVVSEDVGRPRLVTGGLWSLG